MRRYLFLALALLPGLAGAQINPNPADAITQKTFANLGTPPSGIINYCVDCQQTTPCTGSGSGAFAQRVNGVWECAASNSAGVTDPGADGFMVRTAEDVSTARSLTSPLGTLAIGNSDGVASNPTLDVDTSIIGQFSSGAGTAPATCVQGDFYYETDTFFVTACPATDSPNTLIGKAETSTAGYGFVIDEDSFASDSATKVPTQQSTKSYVDTAVAGAGSSFNPSTKAYFYTDFAGSFAPAAADHLMDFGWSTANSGTIANVDGTAIHPGIVTLQTGTNAAGTSVLRSHATSMISGNGIRTFKTAIYIPTLSDGTEGYTVRVGFAESVSAPTKGCWVEYEDSINGGKFQYSCGKGTGTTSADSGLAVSATTWYEITIAIDADGTDATFGINGANSGTINSANMPDSADTFGALVGIVKTSGTTGRQVYVDYVYFDQVIAARY